MIAAVAQPSHLSTRGLTRLPITFLLLVKSTTRTINGGARTQFNTAARNNILTAWMPTKFSNRPTSIETATTA